MSSDNKNVFFEIIQPYVDENILREVYSSDRIAIFSLGDIFYLACPYNLVDNKLPVGIMCSYKSIEEYANNNSILFKTIKNLLANKTLSKSSVVLSPENLITIKNFILNEQLKGSSPHINYNVEEKINNKYKINKK